MKYQIKIIRLNKSWSRVEYDNKEFGELDEILEYLLETLEAGEQATTLLIHYKKVDGVEDGGN